MGWVAAVFFLRPGIGITPAARIRRPDFMFRIAFHWFPGQFPLSADCPLKLRRRSGRFSNGASSGQPTAILFVQSRQRTSAATLSCGNELLLRLSQSVMGVACCHPPTSQPHKGSASHADVVRPSHTSSGDYAASVCCQALLNARKAYSASSRASFSSGRSSP